MSRALVPLLIFCCLWLVSLASASPLVDPCSFPQVDGLWVGPPSKVQACFDSIPFDETVRESTLSIYSTIMDLYSFGDLVQQGLPPFNIEVDWPTEIETIRNAVYASDYAFHLAVAQLTNSLQDAHNVYALPAGYRVFESYRPFSLSSRLVGGTQAFFAEPGNIPNAFYQETFNTQTDLTDFHGRRITHINSQPVLTWLSNFASTIGEYADGGVRLNNLLTKSSQFPFQSGNYLALPADTLSITFEGDNGPTEFFTMSATSSSISSAADIVVRNIGLGKRDHLSSNPFYSEGREIQRSLETEIQKVKAEMATRSDETNDQEDSRLSIAIDALEELKLSLQPQVGPRNQKRQNTVAMLEEQKIREAQKSLMRLKLRKYTKPQNYTRIMHSDASSLRTLQERDAQSINSQTSFRVNTQVASTIAGDTGSLQKHSSVPGLAYWSYKDVTVMKLSSFDDFDGFRRKFAEISERGAKPGLGGDLIIDVTGNSGGFVSLQQFALSFLVRPWNSPNLVGDDILYSTPYEWRQSRYTDDIFPSEVENDYTQEYINPATGLPWPASTVYTPPVQRGDSKYTQKFLWKLASSDFFEASQNARIFDRILIITDGRCGSSCSNMISTLRFQNKVRVLSYGGIWGQSMDTSSFSGGNVYEWEAWLAELRQTSNDFPWMKSFKSSTFATFNYRQIFMPGDDVPRQFISMPADWKIPFWPIDAAQNSAEENQFYATLYESALPLLRQMPAGLAGATSGSDMLAMNLLFLTLLVIATILCN